MNIETLTTILKFSLGYFWLFLITFGELLLGFWILGINKFIILALIVAFLDLLPVIGTGTILIPWTIIEFIKNNRSNMKEYLLPYEMERLEQCI